MAFGFLLMNDQPAAEDERSPDEEMELLQSGYRYALALTHHREESEDLVQEAWLRLTRKYGEVESRALLFRTVRNLFLDLCRRRKIVSFEPEDAGGEMADETLLEAGPVQGDLDALLAQLRPVEREVLHLHYYLGLTAEEIAGQLEKPRGTILSLIHRALAKLRSTVQQPPNLP